MPDDDNEATEMIEAYGQRLETAPSSCTRRLI